MAIIQRIRTRAGLLLTIVVGVALFAFVLGDFITRGGFLSSRSKMNIAVINGTSVTYPEYQQELADVEEIMKVEYQTSALNEEMMENARNQVWQELMQKYMLDREYRKIGLSISNSEFMDLIQGQNPDPLIVRMFPNPETGTLNRLQLSEFLNHINEITPEQKRIWLFYEHIITNKRLFNKYINLVMKGLYANKLETERRQKDGNTSVDFTYIEKKYADVSDSSIVVKESEIKKYYKEHMAKYKQEESRDLKYVAFDVIPSQADYKDAEDWINSVKPEFEDVEDVEQYVNYTSPPYDKRYYKENELPDTLGEFMFNAKIGDVYGPYFVNNTFELAKLAKIKYLPDSVRVSQIFLPANQGNIQQVHALADSLLKLAKQGYDFGKLVSDNSRDVNTIMSNGDMGWIKEGDNGPYFSDTCFFSKVGDIKLTYSEKGLHIVKITNQSKPHKRVQVGIIAREVTPGQETDQFYYSKAVEFATKNNTLEKFDESTKDNQPQAIPAYGVKPLDNEIPGIPNSRKIVRWAFEEAKEGEIDKDIENYGGKYIVAILTKVHHKGYTPVEDVADDIKPEIMKQKKAEIIIADIQKDLPNIKSIDDFARTQNLQVYTANGIRFTSFSVPDAGTEPRLIAAVVNSPSDKIMGPIAGENGVFVYTVLNKETREDQLSNLKFAGMMIERNYASTASQQCYLTLKELYDIKDQRAQFY